MQRNIERYVGVAALVGAIGLGVAFSDVIKNPDTPFFYRSDEKCNGKPVEFKNTTYHIPLKSATIKSLGGATYSSQHVTSFIGIARELGYPNPECFGQAMKEYNSRYNRKLRADGTIYIPEFPAANGVTAGNQARNQRELARP